jgi:TPR repeat protein
MHPAEYDPLILSGFHGAARVLKAVSVAAVLGAGATFAPPAHAQSTAATDDTFVETVRDSIARADAAYALGKFREAYEYYYWAAIRDHARAQEIIGLMRLYGPELFGAEVARDRVEAAFWLREAARRGREVAAFLAPVTLAATR